MHQILFLIYVPLMHDPLNCVCTLTHRNTTIRNVFCFKSLHMIFFVICNRFRNTNTKFVSWKWSATKNVVTVLVAISTVENSSESLILFHWAAKNASEVFQKETGMLLIWPPRACGRFLLVMYKVLLPNSSTAFSEGISSWWTTSVFGYFLTGHTIILKWIP